MSVTMEGSSLKNLKNKPSKYLKKPTRQSHPVRVLLVTSQCWLTTTRLALALFDAGFVVSAACPPGHSLARVSFISSVHRYSALSATRSLRLAIKTLKPQLIIPADDYAAAQIHSLYGATSPTDRSAVGLRNLIEHSLGGATDFGVFYARDQISSLARSVGVLSPEATRISNEEELTTQLNQIGFPAVLKTDGSSGGTGVAIVHNKLDAGRAFRRLATPPSSVRALKRLLVDGDANLILPCLQRLCARVTVQPFIHGKNCNVAVACWEGRILAQVCVEVLQSKGATGPSTVVQIIANTDITQAAERMVRQLRLSGLCGYDFVVSASDGRPHLIDFNPRATQTCYLQSLDGRSPIAALAAELQGFAAVDEVAAPPDTPIVIFPNKYNPDTNANSFNNAYRDSFKVSPELVKLREESDQWDKNLILKAINRARKRWFQ